MSISRLQVSGPAACISYVFCHFTETRDCFLSCPFFILCCYINVSHTTQLCIFLEAGSAFLSLMIQAMRLSKQSSPNSCVSVAAACLDIQRLLCSVTRDQVFPKLDWRMGNTLQAQFVLCKENKLCSLEWKRGFSRTQLMSPMYAPLLCEVTGRTVFTLIISGISFPNLHLVARIG